MYGVAMRIYESKERLEQFLSRKTDELFDQDNNRVEPVGKNPLADL